MIWKVVWLSTLGLGDEVPRSWRNVAFLYSNWHLDRIGHQSSKFTSNIL